MPTMVELTEDELRRLYVEEGLNVVEIGDLFGLNNSTITRRLAKLGVARRKGPVQAKSDIQEAHRQQLSRLLEERERIERQIEEAIFEARVDFVPWRVIAETLGLDEIYVMKKYNRLFKAKDKKGKSH